MTIHPVIKATRSVAARGMRLARLLTSNSDLDPDVDEDEQRKKVECTQAEDLLVLPTTVPRVLVLRLPKLGETF